jgi:aerobic-type carbon monoxide dehydrogenase small subunit (CoxS/CutS family)
VRFTLNGHEVRTTAHPMTRLLDVVREEFGLTGTKEGCGEGECGACTVLLDGLPVNACLVPVAHASGREVTTVEGVAAHALQRAFVAEGGVQCGICTPGFVVAATAIPAGAPDSEVRERLAGNICRCTGYGGICRAVAAWQAVRPGSTPADAGSSTAE